MNEESKPEVSETKTIEKILRLLEPMTFRQASRIIRFCGEKIPDKEFPQPFYPPPISSDLFHGLQKNKDS